MSRAFAVLIIVATIATACGGGTDRVVVAAGTTLVDSGFLGALVDRYEAERPGAEVSVVAEATRQVLELGRRGGADLLLTHAPEAEDRFTAEGRAARLAAVFSSRFLLVGPPSRAAQLAGLDPASAFDRIAAEGWAFLTRNDGSGTHERERLLWELAGLDPDGREWYDDTGQGMGLTLQVADQRRAFTLTEEGALRNAGGTLDLEPVELAGDPDLLLNPYRAIVVTGDGEDGAAALLDWLLSPGGVTAIVEVNRDLFGRIVYAPAGR